MRRNNQTFSPFMAVNLCGFGWAVTQGGLIIGLPVLLSEQSAINEANRLNKAHGIPAQYIKVDSQTATNK
jgi:hypothetical protein